MFTPRQKIYRRFLKLFRYLSWHLIDSSFWIGCFIGSFFGMFFIVDGFVDVFSTSFFNDLDSMCKTYLFFGKK